MCKSFSLEPMANKSAYYWSPVSGTVPLCLWCIYYSLIFVSVDIMLGVLNEYTMRWELQT